MTLNVRRGLLFAFLAIFAGSLFAQEVIKIGISTYRPKPLALAQWKPLEAALNKAIPEYQFAIEIFANGEIVKAVAARQLDFVLANPSSYMLMAERSGLSAPLATLSALEYGQAIDSFGGVIFTRSDQTDIKKLSDIAGKSIASSSIDSFAGYQVQAYALLKAGVTPPPGRLIVETGMPQDNVIEAVLTKKTEVGFIRSGLIESLVREKKLDLTSIQIINRQNLPGFPSMISTQLYPEWPFASMPHANRDLQRKIVSYLLLLHEDKALTQTLGIAGFNVPADYTPVENLLREMRIEPFEVAPLFTIRDVFNRYLWPLIAAVAAILMILLLGGLVIRANRRLEAEKTMVQLQSIKLNESRRQYQQLAEDMPLFLATFTPEGAISYLNEALSRFLAKPTEHIIGKSVFEFLTEEQAVQLQEALKFVTPENALITQQLRHLKQNDVEIYHQWMIRGLFNKRAKLIGFQAVGEDISERKFAEQEIQKLAFYDPLTKLPNRRLLIDRLHAALIASARSNQFGAVLFLDMDKFKTLNDTLGHDCGDLLLIEVAARIQGCVRGVDTVARLGGDEFVVLLEEIDPDPREASQKVAQIAEKVRATLAGPYQLKGNEQHSSPSIGVSLFSGNQQTVDMILKQADLAMYQAKDAGRNAVRFFDPIMQSEVENRAALEIDLRHAISEQQLYLYYQVQVDGERRPLGAEALLRWIHPQRGMVSPAQFIPIAEESSLILEVGGWVLDNACRQLKQWKHADETRALTLAVNVSAQQFAQYDFVDAIAAVLRAHEIEPSRLKLELTEGVVLNDVVDVVAKMHALKALGVGLSMDDFGTGYSSLSYLKQLPLDQIKIDQSFVRDIATDPNDAVMVKTMIDLAQNFRLNVIAEGVETEAQLEFLKENGCMAYQGYFFSKPLPIRQFEALLKNT